MKKKGEVYLLDSVGGAIAKVNSPAMLDGMIRPAEYHEISKAAGESIGTRRLREKYGTTLNGVLCATRPFDFYLYAYATSLNTYHASAISAKVKDIVGRAWKVVGNDSAAPPLQVTDFFTGAFAEMTFGEGMGNVWTDYEALGNGYLEVIPDHQEKPAALGHLPATEVWIRLDGMGFVQQNNGQYSHFRRWGLPKEDLAELPAKDPLRSEDVTDVIHFSRYFPWSAYYGIPCIMPAWSSVALAVLQAEFNLSFFANNAIPDYAVVLEGEWEDDVETTIKEYFRTHLKGQAHKTMAIRTPDGGKITFEKLTSDNAKEASFRLLRQDCRDEILHAHGVPPQKVGIVETGNLGGNLATEQIEEYKTSIVLPGREKVTTRLNRLIEVGFGVKATFEFEPYDTEDAQRNATVDGTYLDRKVLTPNEVRQKRFPDLIPLEGGDEPLQPGGGVDLEAALGDMQREIRQAVKRTEEGA